VRSVKLARSFGERRRTPIPWICKKKFLARGPLQRERGFNNDREEQNTEIWTEQGIREVKNSPHRLDQVKSDGEEPRRRDQGLLHDDGRARLYLDPLNAQRRGGGSVASGHRHGRLSAHDDAQSVHRARISQDHWLAWLERSSRVLRSCDKCASLRTLRRRGYCALLAFDQPPSVLPERLAAVVAPIKHMAAGIDFQHKAAGRAVIRDLVEHEGRPEIRRLNVG
jgi:hypothetical protein